MRSGYVRRRRGSGSDHPVRAVRVPESLTVPAARGVYRLRVLSSEEVVANLHLLKDGDAMSITTT